MVKLVPKNDIIDNIEIVILIVFVKPYLVKIGLIFDGSDSTSLRGYNFTIPMLFKDT